jgi:hypothetical protein
MQRFLYFAGFVYIALCGVTIVNNLGARSGVSARGYLPPERVQPPPSPGSNRSTGTEWFAAMKPFCNPVEVEVRQRYSPPPGTSEGAGFSAACFALAGKMDRARAIIEQMPRGDRASAASVLFDVAHPVADAGDDAASGPMMELVLEYWPNNYMALYHAGMSEYTLGQSALAETHLKAFLQMYPTEDGFNSNAKDALKAIEEKGSGDRLQLRRDVERNPTRVP